MKLLITSALLFLAISPMVQAKHELSYQNSYQNSYQHNRGEFKAKVIESTPIYKYLTVRQPQTYREPVLMNKTYARSDAKSTAIVAGIVGGVIGYVASNNEHKGLGTILGAVIGSSLVHNIGLSNNKHSHIVHANSQHCVSSPRKTHKMRVLDGYSVTYRLQRKIYQTFRQNKPQKTISIYY
jgi:uncharacterized protein YcfJ